MTVHLKTARVAVVQAAPVLFDREATVEKTCRLIDEAAAEGAQLILFPEAFIPGLPARLSLRHGGRQPQRRGAPAVGALLGQRRGGARPGHGGHRRRGP